MALSAKTTTSERLHGILLMTESTSREKPALKDWLCIQTTTKLELVVQTNSNDVVGRHFSRFGEVAVVQQVDFVINEGGHVFVEVVGCANIDVLNQILVAVSTQVFTFWISGKRWTDADRSRTDTEQPLRSSGFYSR